MGIADLAWSLSIPALAVVGWPAVARFRRSRTLDGPASLAAAFALGLLYVQAGAMVLGFAGLLRGALVGAWMAVGMAAAVAVGVRDKAFAPGRPAFDPAWLATGLLFVLYLLLATVPPWYRDEMVYHLALPRTYAVAGGFVATDDNMYASMPLGWESILAALHALGAAPGRFPPFNPRLVGAWTSLAAALGAVGLARALGVPARLARWAAPLFLLVPSFLEFGATAYVEPYLILLATLGTLAALRAAEGRAFVAAAGLFCGAAASVKYPGLAVALFCGVLVLVTSARRGGRFAGYRAFGLFCGCAALFGAAFLVRNVVERGNPFFPFAWAFFGGRGWDDWRSWAYGQTLARFGAGRAALDWLALPWRMFTWRDLAHGFEGSLGPVLGLGAIAGAVAALRGRGPARAASLFALLWALFWALTTQQLRFFLIAAPALIALLLWAVDALRFKRAALSVALAASLLWTAPLAWQVWSRQRTTDWLLSRVDRDALLRELLPDSYALAADLEALVPADGRLWLVWTRNFTYYLPRAVRQDSVFEAWRLEALLDEPADEAAVAASLRRDRISHLLVNEALFLRDENADLRPGRTRLLRQRWEALQHSGLLRAARSWGPLVLYQVAR